MSEILDPQRPHACGDGERIRRRTGEILVTLAAVWAGCASPAAPQALAGEKPFHRWGRLANPRFEGTAIRTALFFAGQAKDGSNPYGCPEAPPGNMLLYTVSPVDQRHLEWSSAPANRDLALQSMADCGINVASMSTWGEDFLACSESWSLWAPMQTSPQSQDEMFIAAGGKPILILPFIESRANWTFYNEFPRWTDGRVAPGTVSQIIHLVERYLQNPLHPEWAQRWAQVYDSSGRPRFAVALIHAASNRLGTGDHAAYAEGFDLVADAVLAATGVRVGFFIDALPPGSNAPGIFKPSPALTGPHLLGTDSLLGVQCFIPEIWMTGSPGDEARIKWKREFSRRWEETGIPFLMDVSPGYDAHLVFPGSARYGHTAAWLAALEGMVETWGCDGLAYNSWNGYTEGMAAMPLRPEDGGDIYNAWLRELAVLPSRCLEFLRGDANADAESDISDAVAILGYLFLGQPARLGCPQSADTDDNGALDLSDAVYLLSYLFTGGRRPDDPFHACGLDPTPDGLTCDSFDPCR
ncbi:MAG: hypothetical protein JXA90_15200 [Planctomycetes bacterium]|nr:hypothetical protein [Planctomycetota bacterium]